MPSDLEAEAPATLFVVATPIGNSGDISQRAIETLQKSARIAAEDTRRTKLLLSKLGVSEGRVSRLDAHAPQSEITKLLELLESGQSVSLVTDAGTPAISDPGSLLVRSARARGLRVVPIPGVSAVTAALSVAGFASTAFRFVGFLPRSGRERKEAIASIMADREVVVFFESPHRMAATLKELSERMPAREALLAREITKTHEEFLFGTLEELAARLQDRQWLGELTIVLGPVAHSETPVVDDEAIARRARELLAGGLGAKQAAELLALETGLSKREAYARVLAAKG